MPGKIIVERDQPVPMRDGITLRADVYHSGTGTPMPVLLQRTPYGKGFANPGLALAAVEHGYVVVIQDTRGRWASEGANIPLVSEKADGRDTLDWITRQPWSNGKIGMYGGSYVGYTQYAAAVSRHPALKTITPAITFTNPYNFIFSGGAFNLGSIIAWSYLSIAMMDIMRSPASPADKARFMGVLIAMVDGMAKGTTFSHVPLVDLPLIGKQGFNPFFASALEHPEPDEMWENLTCPPEQIEVPALHLGGWYDAFVASTLADYCALRDHAASPKACSGQKLLVGPWIHGSFEGLNGDLDFGMQASWMLVLPDEILLRWFDYWLKGIQNGILDEPPVRIFVMGENTWRNEDAWPLARAKTIPYYFHSHGSANTLEGDGELLLTSPGEQEPDDFVYDPRDPVPTRGGAVLGWQAALRSGPYDQRPVESRPDVLVYTSPVLEQDLEVTGDVKVYLWATSSVVDTDFTAKLVDVHPDGAAYNITDGIQRARYRAGSPASLILPGEMYNYCIQMGPTSMVFKAGHRLRVEISSSNFPRFDRNPNTGNTTIEDTEMKPARQQIFHDSSRPSHILLPVIPR